jgi:hypothetical protein
MTKTKIFIKVWESDIIPLLKKDPDLTSKEVFLALQSKYPERGYQEKNVQALNLLIREWKKKNTPQPESCPYCDGTNSVKHGFVADGRQRYLCKDCGRKWVGWRKSPEVGGRPPK